MPRSSKKELEQKYDKFVEEYLKHGNSAEAARAAGYAKSRSAQTGHELLEKPYVAEKIRKYQEINKEVNTDASLSFDEILDLSRSKALQVLAEKAKNGDSQAAKQIVDIDFKYKKLNQEVLGEYEGLSTAEIVREVDNLIEETERLKARVVETFGTEEV